MHTEIYFHEVSGIWGKFYVYSREEEIEPGYLMGWSVNNFTLGGGLESILEDIGDILNADGDVVGGRDETII